MGLRKIEMYDENDDSRFGQIHYRIEYSYINQLNNILLWFSLLFRIVQKFPNTYKK